MAATCRPRLSLRAMALLVIVAVASLSLLRPIALDSTQHKSWFAAFKHNGAGVPDGAAQSDVLVVQTATRPRVAMAVPAPSRAARGLSALPSEPRAAAVAHVLLTDRAVEPVGAHILRALLTAAPGPEQFVELLPRGGQPMYRGFFAMYAAALHQQVLAIVPQDARTWYDRHVAANGFGQRVRVVDPGAQRLADAVAAHVVSPAFLAHVDLCSEPAPSPEALQEVTEAVLALYLAESAPLVLLHACPERPAAAVLGTPHSPTNAGLAALLHELQRARYAIYSATKGEFLTQEAAATYFDAYRWLPLGAQPRGAEGPPFSAGSRMVGTVLHGGHAQNVVRDQIRAAAASELFVAVLHSDARLLELRWDPRSVQDMLHGAVDAAAAAGDGNASGEARVLSWDEWMRSRQ